MTKISRRQFVGTIAASAAFSFASRFAHANPLGLPLGIQLYSVRQQMGENLDEALAAISAAGYTEVEAAALPKKSAKEIRAALDKAGLRCVSAHHPFPDLHAGFDEIVAYDKELGVQFLICSSPGSRTPAPAGPHSGHTPHTLDDWHYNAEQFNIFGEKTAASGIHFGYHNHTPEFASTDGKIPYLELLSLTDPKKVTFELDCGWAIVAGVKPEEILKDHPYRISMLHVKDFNLAGNPSPDNHEAKVTELGHGSIDYHPIFAQAAKTQHIMHSFVEQEAFDMPWKDSLKVDADYLRNFKS
ncbi:sugar phosphate isomerase/epimerase [Granulicella sp. S190]|uniref:sugar phosphate isomerase/epimerase family protein n=1 Tax=Granulicella sp. S190 TaxID=1747226 RepID=UPI0020B17364|nr:sugar phosphate isomerase/epimerase [Granulicella sp. S190]